MTGAFRKAGEEAAIRTVKPEIDKMTVCESPLLPSTPAITLSSRILHKQDEGSL